MSERILRHVFFVPRLDKSNSRENQVNLFPLVLEKSVSISRSRLETRDGLKSIPVLVSNNDIFIQIS